MPPRFTLSPRARRAPALGGLVATVAILAILLHRDGHTQGDDFALYLRQARSVFDGDIGAVVADNRFAVVNSDNGFSPMAYPWGWPLLLSPFVHLWGLDYDRLKVVEVAILCTWLVLVHGIVRRRTDRWAAFGVAAVIGTAPLFLMHTDQLLTEFPHVAAVAVVLWWYDRMRARSSLLDATTRDLIVLGVLVMAAFNMRREGIVLLGVIGVMQTADLFDRSRPANGNLVRNLRRQVEASWRTMLIPHASFVVSTVLFQLLLPTMLLPDNGNSRMYIDDRFGDYPAVLTQHLGIGEHPALGVAIIMVAVVGVVLGVRRRPSLDGPIALLALFSALAISTHFRMVDRYWFQITPWIVYFTVVAIREIARALPPRRSVISTALAVVPLGCLLVAHAVVLPGDISTARTFDADGRVQVGPANPGVVPIYDAVRELTPPMAVIAFFRARTMTLLTDRRSIQTADLDKMRTRADYFAQRLGEDYWQPEISRDRGVQLGFEIVWSDSRWILWRLTPP